MQKHRQDRLYPSHLIEIHKLEILISETLGTQRASKQILGPVKLTRVLNVFVTSCSSDEEVFSKGSTENAYVNNVL